MNFGAMYMICGYLYPPGLKESEAINQPKSLSVGFGRRAPGFGSDWLLHAGLRFVGQAGPKSPACPKLHKLVA